MKIEIPDIIANKLLENEAYPKDFETETVQRLVIAILSDELGIIQEEEGIRLSDDIINNMLPSIELMVQKYIPEGKRATLSSIWGYFDGDKDSTLKNENLPKWEDLSHTTRQRIGKAFNNYVKTISCGIKQTEYNPSGAAVYKLV